MADLKTKISWLPAWTPLETDIIPYVDLVTGTTKKAPKSDLKGLKWDTGPTGATWPIWPQGIQGLTWPAGTNWTNISSVTSSKTWSTTTVVVDWDFTNAPKSFNIEDWADWDWSWDMLKTTYDTNANWIVDNAEKVNWLTVETAVPLNAKFTDTPYTDAEIKVKYENNANTNAFTDTEKTKLYTWVVDKTTAQTIAWVKTFSSSPVVPTPTTDMQTATKKYVDDNAWWGGGWIETVKISGEQIAWTYFFEYIADWAKTVWNIIIALEVANTGASFIVKCYKNWTDLSKDITIADWWGTAVNWRYKANLDVNETLATDDVFELEINQVWSNIAWSDFTSLINIS